MADVLDRIDKLIALALNNPNAEESRSAALTAVKTIREHRIALSLPSSHPSQIFAQFYQPPSYEPPHYEPTQAQNNDFAEFWRAAQEHMRRGR